ncbi:restriction endonuclease subunit S [Streptococcus sp. ZJ93]
MVEVVQKTIGELFTTIGGNSKYSLKYISEHPGDYPVYSAKTTGDMTKGYIDTYDYDVECLQITSDGAKAGTVIYRDKSKFSVGPATRIYLLKKEFQDSTSVKFLYYAIKSNPEMQNFSWTSKASLYKLLDILIDIPVDINGDFDLTIQEEIVRKFELIESRKAELADKIEQIKTVEVDILSGEIGQSVPIKLSDLFDLTVSTNSSKFTKTFVKEHSGNIPVYGASSDDNPSYGYVKDNAVIVEKESGRETPVKYFEDCLTYNIDGLAGYVFYHEGRFTLSEKVRPLVVKEKYKNFVNPIYLKRVLEPIFRANVKGRKGENGKNEYTKLNTAMIKDLEISLPLDSTGQIDVEKQKEIVANAETIATMKEAIERQGYKFIQSNLKFNSDGSPYIYIYI